MLRWLLSLLLLLILALALFWLYQGSQGEADTSDPPPVSEGAVAPIPPSSPWQPQPGERDPQGRSWVMQVGDGWQGGADAPSVGKPSPALDLRWRWQPLAADQGQLTVRLVALTAMPGPLILLMQPVPGATVHGLQALRREEALAAGESWETIQHLQLTGGGAQLTVTYGNQQLQRSLAITLGDQPAQPAVIPAPDGLIHTDEVFLLPAR